MKKSADMWVFSPLVFLACSGLIALIITKGEPDYCYLLIPALTAAMYVWPLWREWPDSVHIAFMATCVLGTIAFVILWPLYLEYKEESND